jgi:hypothetical protein
VTIEAELPDGRILEFPDGTDRAVIQRSVKQALGVSQSAPQNSLQDTLEKIDAMQSQQQAPQRPTGQMAGNADLGALPGAMGNAAMRMVFPGAALVSDIQSVDPQFQDTSYLGQQAKKGVAAALGLPVDTMTNALNLGIAGYGVLKNKLTGSADLPSLITNPFLGSQSLERLFLTNNQIQPSNEAVRVAGRFVRDLSAAAIPGAGIASRAASPALSFATQAGLQTLASTGGEMGRAMAPEGYKDAADLTGSLLGGIAAPAFIANRIDAVNNLRSATAPNKVNRMADQYVQGQIEGGARAYPGAAQNLDDAMRMEQEIPGLKYRVGQASNVPSLLDMERRVATAGPEQFNRRVLQDQAQQAAIRAAAEQKLPLLAGKNDVTAQLAKAQADRRALAEALPETAAEDVGQLLRSSRGSMKGRYDQIAAQKFAAPVEEARKLGVKVDSSGLIEKSQAIIGNPILQFDATNAPAISRRILDITVKHENAFQGAKLVDADGVPIMTPRDRKFNIDFEDLKAMREALNQDIAREAGSQAPNARQRLRALIELRGEVDRTAQQTPASVQKLWNEATSWYRDVYAPKFLRGVNLRQSMKDITGEMKIPDEKLAAQYFKPLGTTPMKRFMDLYGDNQQAMRAMESHILDAYRKYTVRDGVIDPQRHEAFMRNYGAPLKMLPETADNFRSVARASDLLAQRETQLANAQKILSQGQLDALKYENLPDAGLDPRKINAFLTKSGDGFRDSISALYGEKTANEHLKNLKEIAKAAEIADRGTLPPAASPKQDLSPISMRSGLGFTGRTVFSMIRAVTTGRTSHEDVAYTLGAQTASHRITQALIKAEERAISDPDTAKLIAQALKQSPTSKEGAFTLKNILAKGGYYLIGGNKFGEYSRYRAAPFAIDATQKGLLPIEQEKPGQEYKKNVRGDVIFNPFAPKTRHKATGGVRS